MVRKSGTRRAVWDGQAADYDRAMEPFERRVFAPSRAWLCAKASGRVLEVAAGTGLNLAHYPPGVRLTCVDFSFPMLAKARQRSGPEVAFCQADAHALPIADAAFDTAVCTLSATLFRVVLAFPELHRILRPGGRLLVLDHVHLRAGVVRPLRAAGFRVEARRRSAGGLVYALVARRD
ncbi:class I SAM-dependent methyltransferase [Amycolatopsis magusensis]|uniref:class I SAM-dependent methyltransferase n=1 Tax=Amycolatopsis magusensis TaxID=882444 RepID=UPI0024A8265E|nr:class I SAM-dependent methyltransferase [Amycolatopsis magusensis]MDI5978863.1 methyltransferase domain-containing protein [Amycolatopsis magusensis]